MKKINMSRRSKSLAFFAILSFILAFSFSFESCTKDPCLGIVCQNGGYCSNGLCNCPAGYSGSDCATVLNPVSMTITGIDVSNYPVTAAGGAGWDLSSGADPYLAVSLGTSSSSADGVTSSKSDVTGSSLSYTLTTPKVITTLSSNWTIGAWDDDAPASSEFMGGIFFTPNDYKSGFPASFTISTASFTFKVYVTWQF